MKYVLFLGVLILSAIVGNMQNARADVHYNVPPGKTEKFVVGGWEWTVEAGDKNAATGSFSEDGGKHYHAGDGRVVGRCINIDECNAHNQQPGSSPDSRNETKIIIDDGK